MILKPRGLTSPPECTEWKGLKCVDSALQWRCSWSQRRQNQWGQDRELHPQGRLGPSERPSPIRVGDRHLQGGRGRQGSWAGAGHTGVAGGAQAVRRGPGPSAAGAPVTLAPNICLVSPVTAALQAGIFSCPRGQQQPQSGLPTFRVFSCQPFLPQCSF